MSTIVCPCGALTVGEFQYV